MEFLFPSFIVSSFISWIMFYFIAELLEEKGYETSFFFLGTLFTGMKKLSKLEKKYIPLFYAMIVTTLLPIVVFLTTLIYEICISF